MHANAWIRPASAPAAASPARPGKVGSGAALPHRLRRETTDGEQPILCDEVEMQFVRGELLRGQPEPSSQLGIRASSGNGDSTETARVLAGGEVTETARVRQIEQQQVGLLGGTSGL